MGRGGRGGPVAAGVGRGGGGAFSFFFWSLVFFLFFYHLDFYLQKSLGLYRIIAFFIVLAFLTFLDFIFFHLSTSIILMAILFLNGASLLVAHKMGTSTNHLNVLKV